MQLLVYWFSVSVLGHRSGSETYSSIQIHIQIQMYTQLTASIVFTIFKGCRNSVVMGNYYPSTGLPPAGYRSSLHPEMGGATGPVYQETGAL